MAEVKKHAGTVISVIPTGSDLISKTWRKSMSLKWIKEAFKNFFFVPRRGTTIYASGRIQAKRKLQPEIKVKFIDKEAKALGVPFYRKEGDAGVDLYVYLPSHQRKYGITLFPSDRLLLDSGLHLEFPVGYYGRITHRSSTENRKGLRIVEGIIDQGYRGRIYTQVMNISAIPVTINHGDRLAQMVVHKLNQIAFVEVEELSDSDRGEGGFGSTGESAK